MKIRTVPSAPPADLFDKVGRSATVNGFLEARSRGLYPFFQPVGAAQTPRTTVNGQEVVLLAANSYLGLSGDPEVIEAAIAAIRTHGVGTSGSPLLNGTMDLHLALEQQLTAFTGKEACALYSTGFQTNLGVLSSLVGRTDVVLVDSLAHASIHDGCRLSYGEIHRFKHNDLADLEAGLLKAGPRAKLIVVDGVYSMDGDLADLPGIVRLAREHGARILLDDSHGFGTLGATGRGTAEHFGLEGEIDVLMLTFSKSLGTIGGCILASAPVVDFLKHSSRPYVFSASLPPGTVAATQAALRRLRGDPTLRARLAGNVDIMRRGLLDLGFEVGGQAHILPVRVGDEALALRLGCDLLAEGVLVATVISPGVPPGQARLRVSLMASHGLADLERALSAFERVASRHGIGRMAKRIVQSA